LADATSAPITVSLPDALPSKGKTVNVSKVDTSTNIVTLDGNGVQTIAGDLTQDLLSDGEVINIISDGSNWQLVN
jgi:hypothetical protein